MANAKMGLILPIQGATYTFQHRVTAGAWSTAAPMTGGANDPDSNFVSPACDELRIIATTASAATVDRLLLAGVRIQSGLDFTTNSGLTNEPQPVFPRPKSTNHIAFRLTPTSDTTHTLEITGIGGGSMEFAQVVFGEVHWNPDYNYNYGSPFVNGARFRELETKGGYRNKYDRAAKSQALQISEQQQDTLLDLDYMLSYETVDGFCLFERDTNSASLAQDDILPVFAYTSGITHTKFNYYSTTLTMKEAMANE